MPPVPVVPPVPLLLVVVVLPLVLLLLDVVLLELLLVPLLLLDEVELELESLGRVAGVSSHAKINQGAAKVKRTEAKRGEGRMARPC